MPRSRKLLIVVTVLSMAIAFAVGGYVGEVARGSGEGVQYVDRIGPFAGGWRLPDGSLLVDFDYTGVALLRAGYCPYDDPRFGASEVQCSAKIPIMYKFEGDILIGTYGAIEFTSREDPTRLQCTILTCSVEVMEGESFRLQLMSTQLIKAIDRAEREYFLCGEDASLEENDLCYSQ